MFFYFQDSQRSPDLDSPGSGEFPNIMPEYGCGPLQYDIYTTIGMVKSLTFCIPMEFTIKYDMGLDATKPGVSEKARLKPVSSVTETS